MSSGQKETKDYFDKIILKNKEIKIKNGLHSWANVELEDEKEMGRVPTYLGTFKHDGIDLDFDEVLAGGYKRGVPHVITGFPSHGKTGSAIQQAVRQAEKGYKVLYISLEQDDVQLIEKCLGVLEGVPYQEWEKVKFDTDNFDVLKQKGEEILHAYLGNDFHIIHEDNIYIDDLIQIAKYVDGKYDVVYCDNFQNVFYNGSKGRTEEFDRLSNTIRSIVKNKKKTAWVWLSQLTAENGGRDPKKAHTKWSNKLVEDVGTWILIHRKIEEDDKDAPADIAKSYIDMTKNRYGRNSLMFQDGVFNFNTAKGRIGSFELDKVNKRLEVRKLLESAVTEPEDVEEMLGAFEDTFAAPVTEIEEEMMFDPTEDSDVMSDMFPDM